MRISEITNEILGLYVSNIDEMTYTKQFQSNK
jgi:hypothetical protein